MELVDLRELVPDLVLDLRYATARNVFGRPLYDAKPLALRSVAEKVARAARSLPHRLAVFDAYRPVEAQRLMWELKPDPRYVADPARGSRHNLGKAVDCGLADASGRALDLGTDFDDFSARSAHSFRELPAEVLGRRQLLKGAMEAAGLQAYDAEWWHYSEP